MTYLPVADLGIVACYFNPCGFRVRAENFARFVAPIRRGGLEFVVVEAAFPGEAFTLPPGETLQIRARDVMWQKEKLLDVAVAALPARCTKVAWLDADVLFERADWAVEASRALETHAVIQPWEEAVRLPRGAFAAGTEGEDVFRGFAALHASDRELHLRGKFEHHGHTGFAWAARREVVTRHGFFAACIAGSGDHMMAHGFLGDSESPCIARIVGKRGPHVAHFRDWTCRVDDLVQGQLGYVPGRLLHLWHGTIENRRYVQRNKELLELGFDPQADVRVGETGCWEWASDKPELHAWARRYFAERREDEDA